MFVISTSLALYRIIRGRRSQPSHKAGPTEIVVDAGEKDGLMETQEEEHVDPPPSYTEDPAVPRN